MPHPVICFVHGAWHSPEYFHRVISILRQQGYTCVTILMPAVGRIPPVQSLDEDIAAVRSAVLKELDEGRDVIIHTHSWGGIPVNNALGGLSKTEREKDGKNGVVKLTFASSFVVSEGVSLVDIAGEPDWCIPDSDGNFAVPQKALELMYQDLDSDDAKYWISKLRPHSPATFIAKAKSAAWRTIPSAYLICENDAIIPVQGQEAMIATVQKEGGDIVIERLRSSHSPHLKQPDAVAKFIRRAVGEEL